MDELKKDFGNKIQEKIPLKNYTTLKIGGPADYFIEAESMDELIRILNTASKNQIPFLLLGGGSNLLISDEGFKGLVVKNNITGVTLEDNAVRVQAGTSLQNLVDFTIKQGLSGLHKMTGIPGTVGGAVYGNAGAYGQMIGDHIIEVIGFDGENQITLNKEQCNFGYRTSGFFTNKIQILEIKFEFPEGDMAQLEQESAQCLSLRKEKYKPGILCPGSFFRNFLTAQIPPTTLNKLPPRVDTFGKTPAYIFLEELGAKGDQIGDIKIADFHANLFINLGNGTASDFWKLAKKWFDKVKEVYGIELEPEVQLINLPPLDQS